MFSSCRRSQVWLTVLRENTAVVRSDCSSSGVTEQEEDIHSVSSPGEGRRRGESEKHSAEEKGRVAEWIVNFQADCLAQYGFGWLWRQNQKL